ncbi:hypothetical protein B7R74_12515 [Yersinia pseudotuberculosis]|nr:hypothetical protein B7R74_12515 [Yersinia pseudotuberculosis]
MRMHNEPHTWNDWGELLYAWWRGDVPLGGVLLSVVMAGLRVAYTGGGWKKTLSTCYPPVLTGMIINAGCRYLMLCTAPVKSWALSCVSVSPGQITRMTNQRSSLMGHM